MKLFILEDQEARIQWFRLKFIDDINTLIVCDSVPEAIKIFNSGFIPDVMLLDHDLGHEEMVSIDREDTGSGFCRWFLLNGPNVYQAIIHSHNSSGAINMFNILNDSKKIASLEIIPFSQLIHMI